jgi:hypothetical protein
MNLQKFIDTTIATIKLKKYNHQTLNIAQTSWEKYEKQILTNSNVDVQRKEFFEIAPDNSPNTWQDFFNTNTQMTTQNFQEFSKFWNLPLAQRTLQDDWWLTLADSNKDLQHFKTIKDLWKNQSDIASSVTLTCAKEFLCKLYTDIKTLKKFIDIQEVRTLLK